LASMQASAPDLVIADVMISYRLDGCTIARRMHADPRLERVPLLIVSAVANSKEDAPCPSGELASADAFMSKPVDPAPLLECVSALIDGHIGEVETPADPLVGRDDAQ